MDSAFIGPGFVKVNSSGNVYNAQPATSSSPACVQRMSPTGQVLASWTTVGDGGPTLGNPLCLAVDPSGCVSYANNAQAQILKFDPNGTLLAQWGSPGFGPGQIMLPGAMAADSAGDIFIADDAGRVQEFTSVGGYIATIAGATRGVSLGQLRQTQGLTVDTAGNLYISDFFNDRVQRWVQGNVPSPVICPAQAPQSSRRMERMSR